MPDQETLPLSTEKEKEKRKQKQHNKLNLKEDGFGQVYEIISSHERVTWTGLINSIFLHFLSNLF